MSNRETFGAAAAASGATGIGPARADAASNPNPGEPRTFVLVHGGFHGGWCWRDVAALLRSHGHTVHTPTQTGLGERAHLLSKSITLDTFVDDIANVLKWEDLDNVVLVGHSFGGITITGVADRMPERLRQLVYLDALILQNGQSGFGGLTNEVVAARMKAAEASGGVSVAPLPASLFGVRDPAQQKWVDAHVTPHPLGTYTSPLKLANDKVTNGVPAVYVHCIEPVFASITPSRDWAAANGTQIVTIQAGHDAMVTAPQLLTELLERLAA